MPPSSRQYGTFEALCPFNYAQLYRNVAPGTVIHATIAFHWDDAKQTLTIGERKGTFPGMLTERRLQIVFVRENHGAGIAAESKPDKVVPYSGKQTSVTP